MTAYYSENDPRAAAWLRALIARNLIAPGIVDDRSITEVTPGDLRGFVQCHFFAGIGVWSYALRRAGWPDDRPVWTGSCPCQPFSDAGQGEGFADPRHLWPDWFRLIRVARPDTVFGEQVASKAGLGWLDLVSADVEGAGYALGAVDTCSAGVGAPHIRQRLYWVADAEGARGRTDARAVRGGEGEGLREPEGEDARRSGRETGRSGDSVEARGLADANDARSQGRGLLGADRGGHGADQRTPREGGFVGGLADSNGRNAGERGGAGGEESSGVQRGAIADGRGVPSGMADAERERRERGQGSACGRFDDGEDAGRIEGNDGLVGRDEVGSRGGVAGPVNGFWRAADWLFCRDGKWRPVEPGSFPLAHGAPVRVGRLRGYGNALNAAQAQAFVEAYLEVMTP